MVCIRVCSYDIIQFLYTLTHKIGLYRCSFVIIAGIYQHVMTITSYQGSIALPYIHEMHLHLSGGTAICLIGITDDSLGNKILRITTRLCIGIGLSFCCDLRFCGSGTFPVRLFFLIIRMIADCSGYHQYENNNCNP